ncbi:TPA: threonine--tRNA ligase [Candidatus Dependentiae bacterium]|nr:MAG: Threonine-tRNA ligase [candidate division TM6 bacterium GW2011_GWF2_43_87]HBL98666.1 threonine--tRNA ligase [Candidatus Dependentiae bacterium]
MEHELERIRHSTAHLLAHALSQLYPGILFTVGPATESGFFYDFLPRTNLREEDLPAIEKRMQELVKKNYPVLFKTVSKDEARELFKHNPFKLELIEQIEEPVVGISSQGDFFDLCRGDHVPSTGALGHFKLLNVSGVYWRGDKEKPQLQRVLGVAFETAEELAAFIKQREEALEYDHRKIGEEMDLFSLQPEGVGFPFFHPKGLAVIHQLQSFMRSLMTENGYQEIATPTLLSADLWRRSGHSSFYRDSMYFVPIDDEEYAIKPMSCPGAFLIYKNRPRSYRELPMRLSEFGHVHRRELSGVLHGLMRVRAFTQDDAHIMCTLEQMEAEIVNVLKMIFTMLAKTGFETIKIAIATRPENAMGDPEVWDRAIEVLRAAVEKSGYAYYMKEGEGAFYGPKIEVGISDLMGRQWQCSTIQVDFLQPENFDLTYVASSGQKERVVVIHHAIYGSLERFFGILLEHYKGKLPFWIAPLQARILPITDEERPYAQTVMDTLKHAGVRVDMDQSSDPLSGKIKAAQLERIPWMLVIGKKEAAANTVTLRRVDGTQEFGVTVDELVRRAKSLTDSARPN